MRHRGHALTIGVAVAGIALVGVLGPGGAAGASEERVLRLNVNSTDITYLDPALNYDFYGWRIEERTCAMLLGYPDKAGRAERSALSGGRDGDYLGQPTRQEVHYTMRNGFRFSDGTPVTAELRARDRRGLGPRCSPRQPDVLADIVGADKVSPGKDHPLGSRSGAIRSRSR